MADNETPTDDLRTLLSASFDESAKAAAPEPVVEVKPVVADVEPKTDPVEAEPKDGDRERGPDGKFVKKDGDKAEAKPAAEAKPKAEDKPEAKPAAEEKSEDKAAAEAKPADAKEKAIARWSASDKAMFKMQSPEAQDFLLRRNAALEAEFTKKLAPLTELKKDYEPVQQLFAPYVDVLKQKGLTPHTVIQRWADVETKLTNGHGIDIIDGLVRGYGIDKEQLAKRLGFTSSPAAGQSTDAKDPTAGGTDPTAQMLAALERKIAETFEPKLKKIDQWEAAQQQNQIAAAKAGEDRVEKLISDFKTATDEKGDLRHPYYDELEQEMTTLAVSYQASGRPLPDLPQLYEQAVWANPSTRQALLATQKAAQEAKAAEEARAKAASARRAASSVTGAPGSGQSSRPVRGELSLREQLAEAAADLG